MPRANHHFPPGHDWHIIYAAASSSRLSSSTAALRSSRLRPKGGSRFNPQGLTRFKVQREQQAAHAYMFREFSNIKRHPGRRTESTEKTWRREEVT
jgi:hypothetical protein